MLFLTCLNFPHPLILQTDASPFGSPLGVWWFLCVVALTTIAVLYRVVPLFQAASPGEDGSYQLQYLVVYQFSQCGYILFLMTFHLMNFRKQMNHCLF